MMMERRSRSQTRRPGDQILTSAPVSSAGSSSARHASSSRLTEPGQLSLPYSRPPEQARTLSPERRDRYRASYREAAGHHAPTSLQTPPRPDFPGSSSVPHSNSNSYNQYNPAFPLHSSRYAPPGEQPPPRPLPPAQTNYNNNTAPPRPDPPSGYAPSSSAATSAPQSMSPAKSPDKSAPQHQV